MRQPAVRSVLLFAALAVGLLWDPMGFLRMTLLCALVHESGHVLAYIACLHKLPQISADWGGITLSDTRRLSKSQELFVLASGPMANFLLTAILLVRLWYRAGYRLYFLAAISLCTGIYNLLPFGILDGARILQNITPPAKQDALGRIQRIFLSIFCLLLVRAALFESLPPAARTAAFLAPCYLLAQEFFRTSS